MSSRRMHEYGFLEESELPQCRFSREIVLPCQNVQWAITTDFLDIARNHCAAVTVTNLILYFENITSQQQEPNYAQNNTQGNVQDDAQGNVRDHVRDIFTGVHDLIGNGPVFTIRRKAQRCARAYEMDLLRKSQNRPAQCCICATELNLRSRPVKTCEDFVRAISAGHPCALLLAQDLLHWHWILCTGVRIYENTAFSNPKGGYLRIMDNWHRSVSRFYQPGRGSVMISAAEYGPAVDLS